MTQQKATRATINLTDTLVITGWMYNDVYLLSSTDSTQIIGKYHPSIRLFLNSKAAKHLPNKDRNPTVLSDFDGKGSRISLYTIAAVREYWCHWAFAGNLKAQTIIKILTGDSLEKLFDDVFREQPKSKQQHQDNRTSIEQLQIARDLCKARHHAFQLVCEKHHYPANHVHNRLTLKLSGMDAYKARQLDMILQGDQEIGLDHYQQHHELALRQLNVAKRIFTRMRTPGLTWQQQVDTAVERAQKEIPA